ncbi:MAG: DUF1638 domain-containing protein [Acidimicrobiia bacterium]|nr:DUF1638 domain-containing protein [Acidimicrobiia bacterium]
MPETDTPRVLVLACGALAREILDVVAMNRWRHVTLECLPVGLHNRPEQIPAAVEQRLAAASQTYDRILVGYADCGTGGLLDPIVDRYGATRLPGAHCYEFFATSPRFAELHEAEIGTLYLTDYLVKHFDRVVWRGLGLDRHPQLLDTYFGNYTRLVYLSQRPTPRLVNSAEAAAERLGLRFEHIATSYGDLETSIAEFAAAADLRLPQLAESV